MTAPWRPAGTANFRDLGGLPTEDGADPGPDRHEQYGSVAGFLRAAGLEDDVVQRLRDRLVDPAGATAG